MNEEEMRITNPFCGKIIASISCLSLLTLLSCSAPSGNREVAAESVKRFHDKLDDGNVASIMLEADPGYRTPVNEEYLNKVHSNGGKVTSSKVLTSSVQNMGNEAEITLYYVTEFNGKKSNENFVWVVKDGKARLAFYQVNGVPGIRND
jgi:hypothetical protein